MPSMVPVAMPVEKALKQGRNHEWRQNMRTLKIVALVVVVAATLGACSSDPTTKLAGPFPTGSALNANGTVPLNGDGNYAYNRATGSFSRFSSDPSCNVVLGDQAQGCASVGGDGN